ncbi:hypothetical protein B0H10DRAFT_2235305 [Mycena sp. CBHHK59/15]|nr:hypothetical protein B0H10DRAFT_2235305 [Mycena sp. CBHHK59/15]
MPLAPNSPAPIGLGWRAPADTGGGCASGDGVGLGTRPATFTTHLTPRHLPSTGNAPGDLLLAETEDGADGHSSALQNLAPAKTVKAPPSLQPLSVHTADNVAVNASATSLRLLAYLGSSGCCPPLPPVRARTDNASAGDGIADRLVVGGEHLVGLDLDQPALRPRRANCSIRIGSRESPVMIGRAHPTRTIPRARTHDHESLADVPWTMLLSARPSPVASEAAVRRGSAAGPTRDPVRAARKSGHRHAWRQRSASSPPIGRPALGAQYSPLSDRAAQYS